MDIKKTKEADLERGRLTWFLLGLVFVLAVAFVALEYTATPSGADAGDGGELGELPEHDDGFVPMMLPHATLRVVEPQPEADKAAQKARIVDDDDVGRLLPEKIFDPDALADMQAMEPIGEVLRPAPNDTSVAQAALMDDKPLDFRIVESLPQFPGGAVEFMKWLTRNLRYPLSAERQKIEGRVVLQFVVERDGSISGLKVVEPAHPYLDREAMRVLRTMPKWKPGVQNDRPCRTMVSIPVVFRL